MIGVCGRLAAAADHRGGLEAVHVRHVDVEQDHRELALEQEPQRLPSRMRRDHVLAEAFEDGLVDQEFLGQVVHDQDVDFLVVGHAGATVSSGSIGAGTRVAMIGGPGRLLC